MEKCPHCGSNFGYYKKSKVSGMIVTNYDFKPRYDLKGFEILPYNTEMHDSLHYHEYKTAYCRECNKRIKGV